MQVLENSTAFSITAVNDLLLSPILSVENPFYPQFANATNVARGCLPALISLTAQLSAIVNNAKNILGTTNIEGSLLNLIYLDVVQYNYGYTKAYVCCEIPNFLLRIYIVLTLLGWIGMTLALIGALQIDRLDRIPHIICCPCGLTRPFNPFGAATLTDQNQVKEERDQESPSDMEMERSGQSQLQGSIENVLFDGLEDSGRSSQILPR